MRWATLAVVFFSLVCSAYSDSPTLKIMARSSVYDVGEKKGIYCEGTNVPDTTQIEWRSPSGEIVQGRSVKNTRVYVERRNGDPKMAALIIHSTALSDTGNWTCEAGDVSEVIPILVGEKVVMDTDVQEVQADEGKNFKMHCVAKGWPKPDVQWSREDTPIGSDDPKLSITHIKKEDDYVLEIQKLTHEDSGTYTCKVTQNTLSHFRQKIFNLHVHHKPIMFNPKTNDLYVLSPGKKFREEEIYATLDDTKNITCSAKAYPPAKFTWYRRSKNMHDTPIHDADMIYNDNNASSTLMLRLRTEDDLGQYRCTASNNKGSITVIYDVNLGEKPGMPENVTLHSVNSTHITFNVTCGENCTFEGDGTETIAPDNLPITAYEFQAVPAGIEYNTANWDNSTSFLIEIIDPEDTLFEVGPLPSDTEYQVRVRSENLAGFSEWLQLDYNPKTTAHAFRLVATCLLVIVACIITMCN